MFNLLCASWVASWLWLIIVLVALTVFLTVVFILLPFKVWHKTIINKCYISMFKLIGMKQRKVDLNLIVDSYIFAKKSGIYITLQELESHLLAGGNIKKVVDAIVIANSANIDLSIDTAKAIDLAGKDVVKEVKNCINPFVLETETIGVVCLDGIELKLKIKLTMKQNINKIVGSIGKETILARIAESVISCASGFENHKIAMKSSSVISDFILTQKICKDSCYEIVSCDVTSIEIGRDFASSLRIAKIEEENKMASSKAEQRRLQALAEEQEMKVKVQQMNANKVAAEMEVPKAISKACEEGKLNIMDYYKMQNIIADTNMRKAIALGSSNSDDDFDSNKIDFGDD